MDLKSLRQAVDGLLLGSQEQFQEDLDKVFKERTQDFSATLLELLKLLWAAGIERGEALLHEAWTSGRALGHEQISLLFSEVVSGKKVEEVFLASDHIVPKGLRVLAMELQPWVLEKFQKILNAPSLEEAARLLRASANDIPICQKCGNTGGVKYDTGVRGPEGQINYAYEPCDCSAFVPKQNHGVLYDYRTGNAIREATAEERELSDRAVNDGNHDGMFLLEGRPCYVHPGRT